MPEVSIVVPVYNVEKYLSKCIDSILVQTYQDFQLLLIDDGSSDNSGQICDIYAKNDTRIQVIHQVNQGLGGARNSGIAVADGKYLLFVDSDDYIHPQLLEKTLAIAEEKNSDVVMFNAVAVDEVNRLGVQYRFSIPSNDLLQGVELKQLVTISGAWNRLWKRQLFLDHDVRFPARVWYEDLYVTAKLAPYFQKAYYLDCEPLYYYLQRQGSIMHTPDFERITRERIAAGLSIQQYFEIHGLDSKYSQELEFMWSFHCFFLPIREMCIHGQPFEDYAKKLRKTLCKYSSSPMKNPYFATISRKEQLMFRLFWGEQYWLVKSLVCLRNVLKSVCG